MNKKLKIGLLMMLVLALSVSMMAFRPFNGDADEDGTPDQTETLAEVLGIDVETLEAAYETAQEMALEQAIADGKITQEQIDAMGEKEGHAGMRGGHRGMNSGEFLADALGITTEELQAAQQEVHQIMLDQALENGDITQEQYDKMLERGMNKPDFEEGEDPGRGGFGGPDMTLEEQVQQALDNGKITEDEAEAILNGEMTLGKGPGGFDFGRRDPGGKMKPGGRPSQTLEDTGNE